MVEYGVNHGWDCGAQPCEPPKPQRKPVKRAAAPEFAWDAATDASHCSSYREAAAARFDQASAAVGASHRASPVSVLT